MEDIKFKFDINEFIEFLDMQLDVEPPLSGYIRGIMCSLEDISIPKGASPFYLTHIDYPENMTLNKIYKKVRADMKLLKNDIKDFLDAFKNYIAEKRKEK